VRFEVIPAPETPVKPYFDIDVHTTEQDAVPSADAAGAAKARCVASATSTSPSPSSEGAGHCPLWCHTLLPCGCCPLSHLRLSASSMLKLAKRNGFTPRAESREPRALPRHTGSSEGVQPSPSCIRCPKKPSPRFPIRGAAVAGALRAFFGFSTNSQTPRGGTCALWRRCTSPPAIQRSG
jgi:hypothetical protein